MKNLKWFWILAFVGGGFLIVAIIYLLLRASGTWNKMIPDGPNRWVEHE